MTDRDWKGPGEVHRLDVRGLDLRGALDFAIGNEEDAQLRYAELAARVRDPEAAAFFRHMVTTEARHRHELESRRDVLFRRSPERFDTSIVGDGWLPDADEADPGMSAREAMELALRAEIRSREFYAVAMRRLDAPDVRALFEHLEAEEAEHEALLRARLAQAAARERG